MVFNCDKTYFCSTGTLRLLPLYNFIGPLGSLFGRTASLHLLYAPAHSATHCGLTYSPITLYLKVARATTKDRLNLPAWIKTLLLLKIKTKCATTCKALYNLIWMLCAFYKIEMSHIFVRDLVIVSLGDDRPEEEQEWIGLHYRSEVRR